MSLPACVLALWSAAFAATPPNDLKLQPAPGPARREIALANAGFETAAKPGVVPAWTQSQHAGETSYEMEVDAAAPYKGKASFRMTRKIKQIYGSIEQAIAVPPNAIGRKIELAAAMKSTDVGPRGWVLVLTFKNSDGIVSQKRSTPMTGTNKWTTVKINTEVPVGAQKFSVAAILLDGGTGWMDDVHLVVN